MRVLHANVFFVNRVLKEVERGSEFVLVLPAWKQRLIRPVLESELATNQALNGEWMRSLRGGPIDALKAFLLAPLFTVIRIARETNYAVDLNSDGAILFKRLRSPTSE